MVKIEPTSDYMGRYIEETMRHRLEYDGRVVASGYKESYSKRDLRNIYSLLTPGVEFYRLC